MDQIGVANEERCRVLSINARRQEEEIVPFINRQVFFLFHGIMSVCSVSFVFARPYVDRPLAIQERDGSAQRSRQVLRWWEGFPKDRVRRVGSILAVRVRCLLEVQAPFGIASVYVILVDWLRQFTAYHVLRVGFNFPYNVESVDGLYSIQ